MDDIVVSSSSGVDDVEKVDDLLDECWFFGNLLKNKPNPKVLRHCFSDLTSTSSTTTKLTPSSSPESKKLVRAPSLPPRMETKEEGKKKKSALTRQFSETNRSQEWKPSWGEKRERTTTTTSSSSSSTRNKGSSSSSSVGSCSEARRGSLQRTQTMPNDIGRDKLDMIHQDKESDTSMSLLIREALATSSKISPRRQLSSKAMPQSCNIPKPRMLPPRNPESESINGAKETRQHCTVKKTLKKCQSNIEYQPVQGFSDLGYKFNKLNLNPSLNTISGLQDKKQEVKRPYLSEAWLGPKSPSPIPAWVANDSAEDMKAQIKFWARSVATNVL